MGYFIFTLYLLKHQSEREGIHHCRVKNNAFHTIYNNAEWYRKKSYGQGIMKEQWNLIVKFP